MTPRVLLGSARPELRATWRALLGGECVVAELTAPEDLDDSPDADVLLLDAAFLRALRVLSTWQPPALVVLTAGDDALAELARLGPGGWALLPPEVSGRELWAAVTVAVAGLAVLPPDLAERVLDLEAEVSFTEDASAVEPLTGREREVLALLTAGLSNKRIAARLGVSENTVKFHLASVYGKLNVHGRAAAAREGLRRGLVSV